MGQPPIAGPAANRASLTLASRVQLHVPMPPSAAKISPMTFGKLRHLPPERKLSFPSSNPEWEMPESGRHGRLCELIYQVLRAATGRENTVGKDHFVYYDGSEPKRCLAPDAFVKLGVKHHLVDAWKTWELGTPELCVEILSPSDTGEKLTFREKLRRYAALGTRELVVFHADGRAGRRVRAWDRVHGNFVERIVSGERTPCLTPLAGGALGFAVVVDDEVGPALRLVDAQGKLVLTTAERDAVRRANAESRASHAESRASHAEAARARESKLLAEAQARIAELRSQLEGRKRRTKR